MLVLVIFFFSLITAVFAKMILSKEAISATSSNSFKITKTDILNINSNPKMFGLNYRPSYKIKIREKIN